MSSWVGRRHLGGPHDDPEHSPLLGKVPEGYYDGRVEPASAEGAVRAKTFAPFESPYTR